MSGLDYELLDSGEHRKLERFGTVVLDRPRAQAAWRRRLPAARWEAADALFLREGQNLWHFRRSLPDPWLVELGDVRLRLMPTDFGHVGAFPEHLRAWRWMEERIREAQHPLSVLNLFAYTGGATLVAARAGARVCHLDASRKSMAWARDNAGLNALENAPIRWITDDVFKFLKREVRRGSTYDGILLDPPSFGRGKRQEVFKLDEHFAEMLELCRKVLGPRPRFVALTSHAPGYTPMVLGHLLSEMMAGEAGSVEAEEMALEGAAGVPAVPSGSFAGWRRAG